MITDQEDVRDRFKTIPHPVQSMVSAHDNKTNNFVSLSFEFPYNIKLTANSRS